MPVGVDRDFRISERPDEFVCRRGVRKAGVSQVCVQRRDPESVVSPVDVSFCGGLAPIGPYDGCPDRKGWVVFFSRPATS